ncbi:MAG: prepilin-type N-terminal cleavage/methylation domain-containing protein [Saccharofermentans sp.]|nr:prepilin-type N-terminal cleavage/methylation domain-containing protein [Saccharofermentans sp.]
MVCKILKKNSKKGFTLTEMIIVIAIIVVLAGSALTGIIISINDYNAYKKSLEENGGVNFEADAREAIENLVHADNAKPRTIEFGEAGNGASPEEIDKKNKEKIAQLKAQGYTDAEITIYTDENGYITTVTWRWNPDLHPDGEHPSKITTTASEAAGGGEGGGGSEESSEDTSTTTSGQQNVPDPNLPGGNGNNGGGVTVGSVSVPAGYGTPGGNDSNVGVSNVSQSGNNYKVTAYKSTNTIDLNFTKSGSSYNLNVSANRWMLNGMPGYDYNNTTYNNLTPAQKNWFKTQYGFSLN